MAKSSKKKARKEEASRGDDRNPWGKLPTDLSADIMLRAGQDERMSPTGVQVCGMAAVGQEGERASAAARRRAATNTQISNTKQHSDLRSRGVAAAGCRRRARRGGGGAARA